jgi:hypothetical protein
MLGLIARWGLNVLLISMGLLTIALVVWASYLVLERGQRLVW